MFRSRGVVPTTVLSMMILLVTVPQVAGSQFSYETVLDGYYLSRGNDMVVDGDGNAYVIASYYEDHQHLDILVFKLDSQGDPLWVLPIVGDPLEHDFATDIAIDPQGEIWLTGWTSSASFPTTPDALHPAQIHFRDAFLMQLSAAEGEILYCTYLGGDYSDEGRGIAIDDSGMIYLVGSTGSTDFPTTSDAYQGEPSAPLYIYSDAFIMKLNPTGDEIVYSTYFGGFKDDSASAVAVDPQGNITLAGTTQADDFPLVNPLDSTPDNIFVAKLSADGGSLLFGTYFGGSDVDYLRAMAMDGEGFVYLTGSTRSVDLPTTGGAFQEQFIGDILGCEEGFPSHDVNCFDGFLTKLATDGSGLAYSTFLGGSINDEGHNLVVDGNGCAHVVGYTNSPDFLSGGNSQAAIFASKFNAAGSELINTTARESSSAGAGHGLAVDDAGNVYFTGADDAPADIYVAKIDAGDFVTSVPEIETTPGPIQLLPVYPNPFNPTATISFQMQVTAQVTMEIHDLSGRRVISQSLGERGPGLHRVQWNGLDLRGGEASSGVYFIRLRSADGVSRVEKGILIR